MITLNDVKIEAAEKVSSYVHRTPLWKSETLSRRLGTNVYLKMELFQKPVRLSHAGHLIKF